MLSGLFRNRHRNVDFPPPSPEEDVEAIGDIHGRMDLLRALPAVEPGATRIFVGDLVDRGPDSRAVIEHVHAQSIAGECVCLMGNHEAMFLKFLREPESARRWLHFGGMQTLASFGVGGVTENATDSTLRDAARAVAGAVSFDLVAWLEDRPAIWSSGTLFVVHAGLDPMRPPDAQARDVAIWGHPDFGTIPRKDRQWVVHGHTIVDAPVVRNGVVSIDTGAYATGRLTLAHVSTRGDISFSVATLP